MAAVQPDIEANADAAGDGDDPLLACLHAVTRLHGRPVSAAALAAGIPRAGAAFGPADYVRAAQEHGYSARLARRTLKRIPDLLLPATLLLRDGSACVLARRRGDGEVEVILPDSGFGGREMALRELEALYAGYVLFTQPQLATSALGAEPVVRLRRSWFWGTLAAYSPYYLEAALAGLLVNVLTVAGALYVMNVYDRVVPNSAFETLTVLAFGTALAIGFEFCARTLRAYFLDAAGRKADLTLASQIFAQALGIPMAIRPGSSGVFASQLREFDSVREFITSATLTAFMDMPFVAFFIFIVGLLGGPLYLVPLAAVPLVVLVGLLAQWPLARAMQQNMREAAQRHGLLIEAIEGMETIKTLRAEGFVRGRYEESCAAAGRAANRARTLSSAVVHFSSTVIQLTTVVMVFWGVHLIAAGELTVGALVACVILTGRGLAPLQQFAGLMMRYQQARAAYLTLRTLMRQPTERGAGRQFTHRAEVAGRLGMREVGFTYPGSRVETLRGVTFEIGAGEHVAILGRVGSGKSTLLRLLEGLYPASSGVVLVDGIDITQWDPADHRRHVGYVAQDPMLVNGTLRDNIALGSPHAEDDDVLEAARLAGLDALIAAHPAGLQLPVGERGQALSGGQRQAVVNARAFLLRPRVLLLDEPTSAMDHATEQRYIEALQDFVRGRTLVLVTHKPTMLALVSRLVVVDGGKIVMDGPREEVLRALSRPAGVQAAL
ncbi:MAG: type I secretion system permease/ATPase [Gammaproteobacteria bacterium]